jgi:RHS repeat-associated protein
MRVEIAFDSVLNQLRSVRRNSTLMARYAYDVSSRRIAKRVYSSASGGTVAYTRFAYRGANVAFEADSLNVIDLRYVWGPAADDLLAIRDSSGSTSVTYYVTQDRLGSVRTLVKRDGTWMRSQRYGPYGAIVADAQSASLGFELRYGWTGREYDPETGLYYFRARYYSLGTRQFVQEDPIGYGGGAVLPISGPVAIVELRHQDRRVLLEPRVGA